MADYESNIKKSLADQDKARRDIAKEYERDLSGKNGPLARFDAINELIDAKVKKPLNFASGDGTQIFGSNGYYSLVSPTPLRKKQPIEQKKIINNLIWELVIEDSEAAEVSIKCGTILKDASDLSEVFSIQNKDGIFKVADGDKIFLKITTEFIDSEFQTIIELIKDNTWEDYPARYEVSGMDAEATFEAYYYPLYYFDAVSDDSAITIVSEELYAHRVCENSNFELIWAIYQKGTDAALTVPKLIASHLPIPPE